MKKLLEKYGITESQLNSILSRKKFTPKILTNQFTETEYEFGVVSDTHLCSTEEKINELHTFYAICKKMGVKVIVHAGDLVAGQGIYRGQENEIHTFGADKQANYAIKHYPKEDGIITYFITGNHDLATYKQSGVDVGSIIANKRPDMQYIGQYQADLVIDSLKIRLLHPDGGGAYALSYRLQKIAEQITSGQKPHILIGGHTHTSLYFFYRNIHIISAGCFEGQTSFLVRKGINPTIGGWTIKVRIANDKKKSVVAITPSFIPFFRR